MEEQGSSKSSQPRTGRVYFEEDVPFKSSLLGNKQAETGVGSCRYWQIGPVTLYRRKVPFHQKCARTRFFPLSTDY